MVFFWFFQALFLANASISLATFNVINELDAPIYVKPVNKNHVFAINAFSQLNNIKAEYIASPNYLAKQLIQVQQPGNIRINKALIKNRQSNLKLQFREQDWCIREFNKTTQNKANKAKLLILSLGWLNEDQSPFIFTNKSLNSRVKEWLKSILTSGAGKITNYSPFKVYVKKELSAAVFIVEPGQVYRGNFDAFAIPDIKPNAIFKVFDTINFEISKEGEILFFSNPLLRQIQRFLGGWRDENWIRSQRRLNIFIWDNLFYNFVKKPSNESKRRT